MNIRKCENGHFYNGDRYKICPYCEEAKLLQNPDTEKQENDKKGKNRQRRKNRRFVQSRKNMWRRISGRIIGISQSS